MRSQERDTRRGEMMVGYADEGWVGEWAWYGCQVGRGEGSVDWTRTRAKMRSSISSGMSLRVASMAGWIGGGGVGRGVGRGEEGRFKRTVGVRLRG